MTLEVMDFIAAFKKLHSHYFSTGVKAIEVGSLNINGQCREHFEDPDDVLGIDRIAGPGVDKVMEIRDAESNHYDTVLSSESLEHDPDWKETIRHLLRVARSGGWIIVTCAGTGHKTHCSKENPRKFSAGGKDYVVAIDHYRNVTAAELMAAFGGAQAFRPNYYLEEHSLHTWFLGRKL